MSNEDVKWLRSVEELAALPAGTVVRDYEGYSWTKTPAMDWVFTELPLRIPYGDEALMEHYGPFAVSELPADADAPADQTEYIKWFSGLSHQRQDAIIQDANKRNEADMLAALAQPVDAAVPGGMTAEQLVEVTDLVRDVLRNAHNIPQDQFPGHIALTLSRAGYHK